MAQYHKTIDAAMQSGSSADVGHACAEFLDTASDFYKVPHCGIRILAARPLRVRETWASELFGDYSPDTKLIRLWMRTAVKKEITSYGTFLSTLCPEFCHHLDFQRFGFSDSWHTRGFFERAVALYHLPAIRRRNACSGFLFPVDGGELIGPAQIARATDKLRCAESGRMRCR